MILALSLLACRPDPGAPDYPTREPWVVEDSDFYQDALSPGEERLSVGLFYEGTATETYIIDDTVNHFYIYENTFSDTTTDDRVEGYVADTITHGNLAWWGGGIHWDEPKDLSGWEALHFWVTTSNMADWSVGLTGGGVEVRAAVADYGLVADGAWHEIVVPMSAFDAADLTSVTVGLLLVSDTGTTGDRMILDDLYYTRGGE
jgi:hypothetical protein